MFFLGGHRSPARAEPLVWLRRDIADDDKTPDKNEWREAEVAELEDDSDAASNWDEDDELRLAEDDRQPAYTGSGRAADFTTRWCENDGAAA